MAQLHVDVLVLHIQDPANKKATLQKVSQYLGKFLSPEVRASHLNSYKLQLLNKIQSVQLPMTASLLIKGNT